MRAKNRMDNEWRKQWQQRESWMGRRQGRMNMRKLGACSSPWPCTEQVVTEPLWVGEKKFPCAFPKWPPADLVLRWLTTIWHFVALLESSFILLCFFFFPPSIKRLPSLAEFQRNKEGTQVTVHFKAANVSDVQGREVGNFIRSALKHPNSIMLTSGTSNTSCSKGAPRAEKANMLQRQES